MDSENLVNNAIVKDDQISFDEVRAKRRAERAKTLVHMERKAVRNVVTRMQSEVMLGPMSILQMAVHERLRVRVWIRSAVHVRGILTGFLLFFDKHWNLALVDVDEVCLRPQYKWRQCVPTQELLNISRKSDSIDKSSLPEDHGASMVENDLKLLQLDGTNDTKAEPNSACQKK